MMNNKNKTFSVTMLIILGVLTLIKIFFLVLMGWDSSGYSFSERFMSNFYSITLVFWASQLAFIALILLFISAALIDKKVSLGLSIGGVACLFVNNPIEMCVSCFADISDSAKGVMSVFSWFVSIGIMAAGIVIMIKSIKIRTEERDKNL